MRIVHLVSSGQAGGTEASVIDMATGVARAEPDWTVSVRAPEHGMLEERLREAGLGVEVQPFPPGLARIGETGRHRGGTAGLVLKLLAAGPAIAAYRRTLHAALAAASPDILHAHGFKMQVLGALAVPPGARLVWHLHDYASVRPVSARLLRRLAPRVALMLANSDSVAADMRGVCGPRAPIVRIYNGVDLDRFAPGGPGLDLDACAGLPRAPAGTLRIGLIGTFGVWKGQPTFLEAVARLSSPRPIRAYLIGGAQYQTTGSQVTEPSLRAAAAHLAIADRVAFTGPVADPASAMRALDIVVHASTRPEPFGMVIAEAMACGRAVVISAGGGAAELVTDGLDGLTHRPGDAGDLAARLDRLIGDPALRARLGAAARAAAVRRFDRMRLVRELVPLYRKLAA